MMPVSDRFERSDDATARFWTWWDGVRAPLTQALRDGAAGEFTEALQERITQVTLAQEEERRRISRELHDGLGPSLAAIGNRIRACKENVRSDSERAERELEEIADGVSGHIQEIRELIHDLRPLALDQLGLVGAVSQLIETFGHEAEISATLNVVRMISA